MSSREKIEVGQLWIEKVAPAPVKQTELGVIVVVHLLPTLYSHEVWLLLMTNDKVFGTRMTRATDAYIRTCYEKVCDA